jgi:hypothetical protein
MNVWKPDFLEDEHGQNERVRRDRPLAGCWRLLLDFGTERVPGRRRQKHRDAAQMLLGELLLAYRVNPPAWVSYSRHRASYTNRSRYRPASLTYATVTRFVDNQISLGNIEHHASSPRRRGMQSRMRLTKYTARGLENSGFALIYDPPESVVLRNSDDDAIDYADTDETKRMRAALAEINNALASSVLGYQAKVIRSGDILLDKEQQRIPARNAMYRIFNRSNFDLGGRFYGAWWQNIERDQRQTILINGSPTYERDYSQLHPRLLYALSGKTLDGDAYIIDGWERKVVKKALNTLINADNKTAALRSIAKGHGPGAYARMRSLIERIKERHCRIADAFGTGAGLRLMRIDSDVAESVQLKLIRRGIISLPVHDSFLVEERQSGILAEIRAFWLR